MTSTEASLQTEQTDELLEPGPILLTRKEAAALFHVHPMTIVRWMNSGNLAFVRLPSGHRRTPISVARASLGRWYGQPLLRLDEVTEQLRLHSRTIKRWISQDYLPTIRLPAGHIRIPEATVRAIMGEWYGAPLLLPAEAAARLRVSESTLKRRIKTGQLTVIRLPSGHLRIPEATILALAS